MPEAARAVECPLCGYDQEGALASFRGGESCPMRGRCPECGLDWFWGDLLHPAKQIPRWFAENTKRWAVPVLFGTWWRALRPRRFWQQVLVTLPIRQNRLLWFAVVALLMMYLVASVSAALSAFVWNPRMMLVGGVWVTQSDYQAAAWAAIWPIDLGAGYYSNSRPFGPTFFVAVLWFVFMPLPFLVLRDTLMQVQVKRVHLLRICAYSLAALPFITLVYAGVILAATWTQQTVGWGARGTFQSMVWNAAYFVIRAQWFILVLAGIWLGWFWSRAITQYLHLPNARTVVVLMMIASFLAATVIVAYLPGCSLTDQMGYWLMW